MWGCHLEIHSEGKFLQIESSAAAANCTLDRKSKQKLKNKHV
jgi:hypothetical protein